MTRSIYKARAKRIFFNIFVAIFIAALFGLTLYFTWMQFQAEQYMLASAGLGCSVLLVTLFFVAREETSTAIKRRGYSRPIGTSSMNRVVKSIFQLPVSEFDKSHPSEYQRSRKTVYFDDGSSYDVDLGKFYFVLLAETGKNTGMLSWENSVVKNKMDKKAWAAYRKLLTEAQVVEVDGRGSMRLNCQPWAAIEVIKERC
jgi:hypothetical protein